MVMHTCPICGRTHEVPPARAQVAYGQQFTCSPDCEIARRRRMRQWPSALPEAPAKPSARGWQRVQTAVAQVLHTWVSARTRADLAATAIHGNLLLPRRRPGPG